MTRLIAERGYPTGDYDDRIAHLSVEHARTLDHYRWAHDIHLRHERGEATTEDLRQALVHYRALFADLLGEEPVRHYDGHERRHDGHEGRVDGDGRVEDRHETRADATRDPARR